VTKAFLTVEEKNANELNRSSRAGIEKNENEEEKHTQTLIFQSDFFLRISTEREREREKTFLLSENHQEQYYFTKAQDKREENKRVVTMRIYVDV